MIKNIIVAFYEIIKDDERLTIKTRDWCLLVIYPSLHAIRLSMSDYREQGWITNIPLYAVNLRVTNDMKKMIYE